jgi:hypothetical protein
MKKTPIFLFVGGHTQGRFLNMKRQNFTAFCVLLVLVLGFIGCDTGNGTTSSGNTDPKSVTIENITLSGQAGVFIFTELPQGEEDDIQFVAVRYGTISENSLSVELTVPNDNTYENPSNKWTGNGDYYVAIIPVSGNQMQENAGRIFVNGGNAPVKVAFDKALTTLDFGKFKLFSELSQ